VARLGAAFFDGVITLFFIVCCNKQLIIFIDLLDIFICVLSIQILAASSIDL